MGLTWAPYYQLARVNAAGPETKDYAVTDNNWLTTSLLLKRQEQHHHDAATPMRYPGYNIVNPATPATPLLTLANTGGSISAGVTVGVRLAYVDQYGLETEGSPETFVQTPSIALRPNAPTTSGAIATPVPGGITGGTYVYAITKRLGTGESALSDVLSVDVPYTTTAQNSFVVPLSFDAINTYTDSTDSILIYRTTGYDTNFVLLTTLTATPGLQNATNTYTDNGSIQESSQQPPSASQFGRQNLLTVDWTTLNIPTTAYRFRVYLTQQAGVWGTQHLFQDYLLSNPATPVPNSVQYFGTETLTIGYPYDFTQIPFGAAPVYLPTEAYGAPIYTQPANAQGYQTWNFTLPDQFHATPIVGNVYVDTTTNQLKVMLSSAGYSTLAPQLTNLFTNDPSLEYFTISKWSSTNISPLSISTESAYSGTHSIKLVPTGATPTVVPFSGVGGLAYTPVSPGTTYAASFYSLSATPSGNQLIGAKLAFLSSSGVLINNNIGPLITEQNNTWIQAYVIATAPSNAVYVQLQGLIYASAPTSQVHFFDAFSIVASNTQGPYFDGDTSSGIWLGTKGASISEIGTYIHPTVESGGHAASHIQYAPQVGGPTVDQILNVIATPVAGPSQVYRKPVTAVYKVTATPADEVQSAVGSWTQIPDMTTAAQFANINPSFTGQWMEMDFQTWCTLQATTSAGAAASSVLTINGVQINETMCTFGGIHATPSGLVYGELSLRYATPITRSNNTFAVQWMLNQPGYVMSYGGNVPGTMPRRYFTVKELF